GEAAKHSWACRTHLISHLPSMMISTSASLYCAGVSGVPECRRGPWALIFDTGGVRAGIRTRRTYEETRVLNSVDYGNAPFDPGLDGSGGGPNGTGSGGGRGSGQSCGSGSSANAPTPAHRRGFGSDACCQASSRDRRA